MYTCVYIDVCVHKSTTTHTYTHAGTRTYMHMLQGFRGVQSCCLKLKFSSLVSLGFPADGADSPIERPKP